MKKMKMNVCHGYVVLKLLLQNLLMPFPYLNMKNHLANQKIKKLLGHQIRPKIGFFCRSKKKKQTLLVFQNKTGFINYLKKEFVLTKKKKKHSFVISKNVAKCCFFQSTIL